VVLILAGTFAGRTCFEDPAAATDFVEPSALAREVSDHLLEGVDWLRSGHSLGMGHRHRDLHYTGSHREDPAVVAPEEVPSHIRCNVEAIGEDLVERSLPFEGQWNTAH